MLIQRLGQVLGRELSLPEPTPNAAVAPVAKVRNEIVLVMIVKNETRSIEETLRAAAPFVTSFLVLDTGSTDGTQELVRRVMGELGLPGEVEQAEWDGYAASRNRALALARSRSLDNAKGHGHAEPYLLMLDATETVIAKGPLSGLDRDGYYVRVLMGGIEFDQYRLFRAAVPWAYVGERHEAPTPGVPYTDAHLEVGELTILERGRAQTPEDQFKQIERFSDDARVFERKVREDSNDTRSWFYLAQSYRDSVQFEKALAAYTHRATMKNGYDEEVYCSLLEAARIKDTPLGRPYEEIREAYLQAFVARPTRAEALYSLGWVARRVERFAEGVLYQRQAVATVRPPGDRLFVEPEVYTWKAKDELSVNLYWIGEYAESLHIATELLASPGLPPEQRQHVTENIEHCKSRLRERGVVV
jgi:tetratricopeptide (TPR) repeat protein